MDEITRQAGVPPAELSVLIVPDLFWFERQRSAGTDPRLVEHLIDLLHTAGYHNVSVGATSTGEEQWLENRDVLVLADLAGYRFVTDMGHEYEFLDLAADAVPFPFPEGAALHGAHLSQAWTDAHFRINFAKNKTHEELFYALCLHNLLSVLPLSDKLLHYRVRSRPWHVCEEVLRHAPPHFNLIDAIVSSHGSAGAHGWRPLYTGTIIAGCDTLLTDWAGAVKMRVDPYASPLNARALATCGLPKRYEIIGDVEPYPDWRNVHPIVADAMRQVNDLPGFGRTVRQATLQVDRELFPFKSDLHDRINAAVARLFAPGEDGALAAVARMWMYGALAGVSQSATAWRTLVDKGQLRWQEAPLDLELEKIPRREFAAIVDYIEPLETLVHATPSDKNGLKWRYLGGSVLFELSRELDVELEQFVERVDISRANQLLPDYLGGCCVPVTHDKRGRVTRQAERNFYLPQPNYLVLYGGKPIDVSKIEYVTYGRQRQKIVWRTLTSTNRSAEYDDGSVTFSAARGHRTRVTIFARQKFAPPWFWDLFKMELNPALTNVLVGDAYFAYFDLSIRNFEAVYHGMPVRIGKPWQDSTDHGLRIAASWRQVWSDFANRLDLRGLFNERRQGRAPGVVDEHGFRHFPGSTEEDRRQTSSGFLTDLGRAIRDDLGLGAG